MAWIDSFICFYEDRKVSYSKRNTADMLSSKEVVVSKFTTKLQENLKETGGPQQLFGAELLPLLFGFAIEFFQGCLERRSSKRIARDMANPTYAQEFILERRLARKVFRGHKNYEANNGRNVYEALLKTTSEAEPEELEELVDYVQDNDIPEVDPEELPIYLPEL